MAYKSRMEKNKHLHDEINREIALKQSADSTRSTIHALFEKLRKIDQSYFEEKIREFDKKNSYEKPYLFEDKSKSILSEDLKFEIKKFISELDELKVSEFKLENYNDSNKNSVIELRNEQFEKYKQSLLNADKDFQNKLFIFKSISKPQKKFTQDIKMDIVEQVRNNDVREVYKMVNEVYIKLDSAYVQVHKKYKSILKRNKMKHLIYIVPIMLCLMAFVAVLPVFI